MPKTKPFDEFSWQYDSWFIKNDNIYSAELNAIKEFIPAGLYGVEVGVGTGRFALPLGIEVGIEPSKKMAEIARNRGIKVLDGVAEYLPFDNDEFDFVLIVTAICFFDDIVKAFNEAYRVLKKDGFIVIALIDKDSEFGKLYEQNKQNSKFYKEATFYSVKEVVDILKNIGFNKFDFKQIIFNQKNIAHNIINGYGKGSFVVVKAIK